MKTNRNLIIVTIITLLAVFASCQRPVYSPQLVEADSAIYNSEYKKAEELLNLYNKKYSFNEDVSNKMYFKLLRLQLDDKNTQQISNLGLTDSLADYFKDIDHKKYAQALFLKGCAYYTQHDSPSALDYFQQAIDEAQKDNNNILLCWIYSRMGNLYRYQGLTEECIRAYRRYYYYAQLSDVPLQKSGAAYSMSLAQTYLQHIDSAIFFKVEALEYAKKIRHTKQIKTIAVSLADLYIQLGKYDKARQIMQHAPEFNINWAYFYMSQDKLDSAAYYFTIVANNSLTVNGAAEIERDLYDVEKKRHNIVSSFKHLEKHLTLSDSAQKIVKTRDVLRTRALYDYSIIKKEKEEVDRKIAITKQIATIIIVLLVILIIITYLLFLNYKRKRENIIVRERMLKKEEERKNKESLKQIEKNNRKIKELQELLVQAKSLYDNETAKQLSIDTKVLLSENEMIQAAQEKRDIAYKRLITSAIYLKIKHFDGTSTIHISEDEWRELGHLLDESFDNLTSKLIENTGASELELRICYLRKIDVSPVLTANILNRGCGAISMARKRLYTKLTGKNGSAQQFDEYLMSL